MDADTHAWSTRKHNASTIYGGYTIYGGQRQKQINNKYDTEHLPNFFLKYTPSIFLVMCHFLSKTVPKTFLFAFMTDFHLKLKSLM